MPCMLTAERAQGLRFLTKLRKLTIDGNFGGDDFVPIIAQITGLQILTLGSYDKLSNKSVPSLLAMPRLLELSLRGNKGITDDVFDLFLNNTTLQKLDVFLTGMSLKKQFRILDKYKRPEQKASPILDDEY